MARVPAHGGRAQRLGFLGPDNVERHAQQARAFWAAAPIPDVALDLGSGGGVPGLALAAWWPSSRWILLEGAERRAVFLTDAVQELGLTDRVAVVCAAAEDAGRDVQYRAQFDLVVARSFGPPAVVAECGAPFLRGGGCLVVSEPPEWDPGRWPADQLAGFGLELTAAPRFDNSSVVVLRQGHLAGDEVPRRTGIPARRPRW
jgi:16S rRNA (guanine527-N7)-methyltransferase